MIHSTPTQEVAHSLKVQMYNPLTPTHSKTHFRGQQNSLSPPAKVTFITNKV